MYKLHSQGSFGTAMTNIRNVVRLQVHGFMMFFAWGLLFPGGAMVARYLKHINKDGWIR